jgi:hypothetical protein
MTQKGAKSWPPASFWPRPSAADKPSRANFCGMLSTLSQRKLTLGVKLS